MTAKGINIVRRATLPDGSYPATRSGCTARVEHQGGAYEITTSVGVRGINIQATVRVNGDSVTVEAAGAA